MKKNTMHRYTKVLTSTAKRYLGGIDKSHDIRHLTFEVTNLCNSKCEMCHIWANKKNPNELTTEEIEVFFSDPVLKNLEDVIITGGEAFVRDDLVEIVEFIWKINQNTNITLSTNGILSEKICEVAEKLSSKKIPILYGISLDGLGEKHNSRRRVDDNFEIIDQKLIPGLKAIEKKNPGYIHISVGHCLDEYGSKTFDEVKSYCEEKNIGFMTQLIEDFDYYLPEKKQKKIQGDWKKIHEVKVGFEGDNRLMKKDIYSDDKNKYINIIDQLPATVHHYRLINVLNGKNAKYECSSMRNFFLLKYDGAVTPCLRFCTTELGNIKKTSISSLLNSNDRVKAVEEILKCEGCLNTWCTDWSMEKNAVPFKAEVARWAKNKVISKLIG
jgi:MoaA/NifB/PqqE/SkfB family radical SAM enzyme